MKHGVYVREQKTSVSTPVVAESGVPFVVGTAPVHSAESPAALFTPVLCTDWEDAVKKLGYSDDWKTYTICEVMYSHFKLFQRQPIIFCNVLDPSTNKEAVAGAEVTLSGKQAKLPFDAILSSLVVKTASSSESPLVKDTDYAAYYSDGNLIVETIEDGAAKAATKLYISYDKIKTADIDDDDKLREEQNKAAEDIADFRTGFSETMDAISGDLEATIDDMDLGTEAAESGRATIQGFIDGATGMLPTVQSAYSQLGYAALAALSRNVQNNNSVASSRRMSGFSRYASGTTSAETGLALVGEEGPEFVMMHGGEAVLNAADTHSAIEAMTSTSDSSVPVQVNITVEGDVNDGVMERLETYGEEFAAQVRAVIREDNINAQRGAYR